MLQSPAQGDHFFWQSINEDFWIVEGCDVSERLDSVKYTAMWSVECIPSQRPKGKGASLSLHQPFKDKLYFGSNDKIFGAWIVILTSPVHAACW